MSEYRTAGGEFLQRAAEGADRKNTACSHLVCVQELFSPVLCDVLFPLQEADTWVAKIK